MGHLGDSDDWDTGYFLQGDGGLDDDGGIFTGPRIGEAVYMHYTVEDEEKAFGIVMNRSWNLATTTTLPTRLDSTQGETDYNTQVGIWSNEDLGTFNELSTNEGPSIKLKNMGGCNKFEIKYFDPYTLAEISTAEDNTPAGGNTMKLKDFPELTFERPYVLFTVTRIGDCVPGGNGMQEENDDTSQIEELKDNHPQANDEVSAAVIVVPTSSMTTNTECIVSPNPTRTIVTLNCEMVWNKIDLFNSVSQNVPIHWLNSNSIELSSFPSGHYYLRVTFDELVETFKIVKL